MKNINPAISVIMPTYNMGEYIEEAIDSILNQTLRDFEFIIIDDSSTDNTESVVKSYNDERIIYLKNERNLGNYPSRNRGMRIAKGRYIAVMDADDYDMPNRLQVEYDYLENHPEISAVGSDFIFYDLPLDSEGIRGGKNDMEARNFLLHHNCFLHPAIMIRTNIMKKLNGYNEKYTYASDYDLMCRIFLQGQMVLLPDILVRYRRHSAQISQSHRVEQNHYVNEIRRKYQIECIKNLKSSLFSVPAEAMVAFPALGICIYEFCKGKANNDIVATKEAEKLLDHIMNRISNNIPVCLEKGLCGIGCGLMYLLRNGFVAGDEDEILEAIDLSVRRRTETNIQDNTWSYGLTGLLIYLRMRIEKQFEHKTKSTLYNMESIRNLLDKIDNKSHVNNPALYNELINLKHIDAFSKRIDSLLGNECAIRKMDCPLIYAIVVLYNGIDFCDRCFGSIIKSSFPVKIIAVDNASTDATCSKIESEYPDVYLIRSKINIGFAKANNIGMEYAIKQGADYVLLLNQDVFVSTDTVKQLLELFYKHSDCGIASPIHLTGIGTDMDRNFMKYMPVKFYNDLYFNRLTESYKVQFINAAAWLISIECIKKVGLFDTDLFVHYGEDDNYCQRVIYHGFSIYVTTRTTINHARENRINTSHNSFFQEKNRFLSEKIRLANINVHYDIDSMINDTKKSIIKYSILLNREKVRYYKEKMSVLKQIKKSREQMMYHSNFYDE